MFGDPRIILLLITLSLGYEGYQHGVKPAVKVVAHKTVQATKKVAHLLHVR